MSSQIDKAKLCQIFPAACQPPIGPIGPDGPPIWPQDPKPGEEIVDVPESVLAFASSLPPNTKFLTAQQWVDFGTILLQEGLYNDAMTAGEISVFGANGGQLQIQTQGLQLQANALLKMGQNEAAQIALNRVHHIQSVARLTAELQLRLDSVAGL